MTDVDYGFVKKIFDSISLGSLEFRAFIAKNPSAITCKVNDLGETLLHHAAIEGFRDVVKELIERGADVNCINDIGETPLSDVIALGNRQMVEILVSAGANRNFTSPTRGDLRSFARSNSINL